MSNLPLPFRVFVYLQLNPLVWVWWFKFSKCEDKGWEYIVGPLVISYHHRSGPR